MKSLLLLTHNNQTQADRCLRSLTDTLLQPDVECIVLDNGSSDGTPEFILAHYPYMTLLRNESNAGVASGRKQLMEAAHGEVLVFLDSDTIIENNHWLDKLTAPLLACENLGVTGISGAYIDWPSDDLFVHAEAGEVDVVSGWCMAFKRECALEMDTAYDPYWFEDADLCMQARANGYDVWALGYLGVTHHSTHSSQRQSSQRQTHYFRVKWANRQLSFAEDAYYPTAIGFGLWLRRGTVDELILSTVQHEYFPELIDYSAIETAVDVGAHIGAFTCFVKRVSPLARAWAVEAMQANYNYLRLNTYFLSDVKTYNAAIAYEKTGLALAVAEGNTGGHGWSESGLKPNDYRTLESLDLPAQVDILKLDCEGAEFDILAHADVSRFRYIVGEYHTHAGSFADIAEHLSNTHKLIVQKPHGYGDMLGLFLFERRD